MYIRYVTMIPNMSLYCKVCIVRQFIKSSFDRILYSARQVSQYKTGKASLSAQGKRRYDKKQVHSRSSIDSLQKQPRQSDSSIVAPRQVLADKPSQSSTRRLSRVCKWRWDSIQNDAILETRCALETPVTDPGCFWIRPRPPRRSCWNLNAPSARFGNAGFPGLQVATHVLHCFWV